MKLAIIGDIHSNIHALDAVLNDIKKRNVDKILSTGDLIGYLPFPNEVIETIKSNSIISIQGNHDHYYANSEAILKEDYQQLTQEEIQSNSSKIYTNYVLTSSNRDFLRQLPQQLKFEFQGYKLLMVHGSPHGIAEYLYEESNALRSITSSMEADILVCGHTHLPYYKVMNGKHVINSGSVGKPKHGNANATYVLLDFINSSIQVEITEVTYDLEPLIEAIHSNDMISNQLIENLKKGI
jgi:putative phosphoesterase